MPHRKPTPAVLVVRTILWIILSTVFILWNANRIANLRAAGLKPSSWAYGQLAIWCVALLFWLATGWRDWTRRDR